MTKVEASSRPEAAFVLLLMQSIFWLMAGLSAAPFALGGEVFMAGLAAATLLVALGTCLVGIGVLWRRAPARGLAIALEVVCLAGSALVLLLPISVIGAKAKLFASSVAVPDARMRPSCRM